MSNWLRQSLSLKDPIFFFLMNFRSVFRKAWTKERKLDLLWINEKIKTSSVCALVTSPLLIRETHLLRRYCCLCAQSEKDREGEEQRRRLIFPTPNDILKTHNDSMSNEPYKKPEHSSVWSPAPSWAMPSQPLSQGQVIGRVEHTLTVKTTFRLLSISISFGNPLLPHRTR